MTRHTFTLAHSTPPCLRTFVLQIVGKVTLKIYRVPAPNPKSVLLGSDNMLTPRAVTVFSHLFARHANDKNCMDADGLAAFINSTLPGS